jgi:hypothetical protein
MEDLPSRTKIKLAATQFQAAMHVGCFSGEPISSSSVPSGWSQYGAAGVHGSTVHSPQSNMHTNPVSTIILYILNPPSTILLAPDLPMVMLHSTYEMSCIRAQPASDARARTFWLVRNYVYIGLGHIPERVADCPCRAGNIEVAAVDSCRYCT